MTNRKTTRRALVLSLLSLLLCCSMLVGTTFAWFTDSVTSGKNQIVAGNLDIELEYSKDMKEDSWADVKDAENLFSANLWEPGHTEVVYLRLSNQGTLALKYQFEMAFDETIGTNVAGETFKLSQFLKYDIVDVTAAYANRDAARDAVKDTAQTLAAYSVSGEMLGKTENATVSKTMALVIYMPEEVDNKANYKTGTAAPTINLYLNLFATQLVSEEDSFGPDYDAGAAWTGDVNTDWYFADPDADTFTISTVEELAGFAALVNGTATAPVTTFAAEAAQTVHDNFDGHTVKLAGNVDLREVEWTPIGRIGTSSTDFTYAFKGVFDGQGHTVSNLKVTNYGWAGLFGLAHHADIKNVNIYGATINSNRMAGAVVGQIYGSISGCSVTDSDIKAEPNAVGDSYDNGDKVGGIVGWLGDNGENRSLTGCTATDVRVGAYRDVGGIAGYVATSTTISGNTVKGSSEITADQTTNFYGEKDPNAGAIFGRGSDVTVENNTVGEEVSVKSTYYKNGVILASGTGYSGATLYKVPADYAETTVSVPEGVTNIGGYAFAYNSNVQKIVLPSTVTTLNDRAFRDTSASQVVLNEGLTNISYQAFRNALNVKSVEIPSTVTTISKEAFQNSGITELVIPANVTTIEYGGLRDMKMLEKVTIEGNVDIPVYAFRACTNLRTVILNGENVTFGGGSRGMIFTNTESGDGSAITVIVKNDAVKERLLAADTAAKDYGGYTIICGKLVSNVSEINEALANGGYVSLGQNVNEAAVVTAPYGNKTLVVHSGGTFDGNGKTLGMTNGGDNYVIMTAGGTIKNLTVNEGFRGIMIMSAKETVYIDGVTVGGPSVGYALNTGEGDSTQDLIVTNSSFYGWNSWSLLKSASFTKCTFGQGTYWGATSIYGRLARPYVNTVFAECAFNAEGYIVDISQLDGTIDLVNCTLNGKVITAENFAELVDLSDLTSGGANLMAKVMVNGVLVFDEANP